MSDGFTYREIDILIGVMKDYRTMSETLRMGDLKEQDDLIAKLERQTEASVQASADNLNAKMARSRSND